MRLSSKNIATTILAVALPIVSMSAPGAGAQTASEKQTTQQSQTSKPSTTTSQPKSNQKDSTQQTTDPSAQNQGNQNALQRSAKELKEAKDVEGDQKTKLLEIAYAAFDKNAVLEQGQSINKESTIVKQLSSGSFFVSSTLDGATKGSVISAIMSADGRVEQTYQISLKEESPTSGNMKTYIDGKVDKEQQLTEDDVSLEGLDWDTFEQCLVTAGIPRWSAAGLHFVCTSMCASGFKTCIGCITSASALSGGQLFGCAYKNWE